MVLKWYIRLMLGIKAMKINAKSIGLLVVLTVFFAQMLIYSLYQPQIRYGNGRGDDGITYGSMAEQILAGQPITGSAPFVYRLGASWIAAKYSHIRNVSVDQAFRETNSMMMFAALVLLYLAAIRFAGPAFAALATILFSLPWWSYTRMIWFYPVLNDLPFLLLMFIALAIILWWPLNTFPKWRIVALTCLCFITPIMRETGLLVPVIYIASRTWFRRHISLEVITGDDIVQPLPSLGVVKKEVALGIFFISLSIGGILLTRLLADNSAEFAIGGSRYTFFSAAMESIRSNTIWHFAMSFFLAYGGPLIALFVVYHRYWRARLQQAPVLIVYWGAVLLLSLLGGVNTLRFLSWASPVALVLIAHLAHRLWVAPATTPWRFAMRGTLLLNLGYYILMIHPFGGYFDTYDAWVDWGGLQFSSIRSIRYLIPCLGLFFCTILLGRKVVNDATGEAQQENPPFPEAVTRL
jgi:hypothetical protein